MTEITATELKHYLATSSLPVLVDLFSPQCGPCRQLAPILEELAAEFQGRVILVKLNAVATPESTQFCADWGVQSVPTLLIFRNSQESARHTGAASKAELRSWIEQLLKLS